MDRPSSKVSYIHLAEIWYNTSAHTAIGLSRFKVLYGQSPPRLLSNIKSPLSPMEASTFTCERQQALRDMKGHLDKSIVTMKHKVDGHDQDIIFELGEIVLVKLQKYRQNSMVSDKSNKSEWRFFGPFIVVDWIGEVACHLKLPTNSYIYDIFHCLLKKYTIGSQPVPPSFPDNLLHTSKDNLSSKWEGIDTTMTLLRKCPRRNPTRYNDYIYLDQHGRKLVINSSHWV